MRRGDDDKLALTGDASIRHLAQALLDSGSSTERSVMQTAFEFWRALADFAAQVEQLPGSRADRLREIVNGYSQAQSAGIDADLSQLQALAGDLAAIERLMGDNGQWDV